MLRVAGEEDEQEGAINEEELWGVLQSSATGYCQIEYTL